MIKTTIFVVIVTLSLIYIILKRLVRFCIICFIFQLQIQQYKILYNHVRQRSHWRAAIDPHKAPDIVFAGLIYISTSAMILTEVHSFVVITHVQITDCISWVAPY